MGAKQSNLANISQQFYNQVVQQTDQSCIASVSEEQNNNVIIIQGGIIDGNFTGVSATVSCDASCLMVSNMDNTIDNILGAIANQTNQAETDISNVFNSSNQNNTFNVNQTVSNNIAQINNAVCSSSIVQSQNNNYVYTSDETVHGNFVGVNGASNAQANCSMNNNMQSSTYNQAQASADQGNSVVSVFGAIIAAFAMIIFVIVIGVVIMFSVGAVGTIGYEYLKHKGGATGMSASDTAISAAEALGLSAQDIAEIAGSGSSSSTPTKTSSRRTLPSTTVS